MHIAAKFCRPDVDRFLSEIPHDDYQELLAHETLEPSGWRGFRLAVMRIVWAIFQTSRKDPVKEFPFNTAAESLRTPEQQQYRDQIEAIRNKTRARVEMRKAARG